MITLVNKCIVCIVVVVYLIRHHVFPIVLGFHIKITGAKEDVLIMLFV